MVDTQQAADATWSNRVVGHGEEAPTVFLTNPRNWRVDPKHQQRALAGARRGTDRSTVVVVNQRSGYVLEGHARVALAISRQEPRIPIVYVDLDQEEEETAEHAAFSGSSDPATVEEWMSDFMMSDDVLREMRCADDALAAWQDPGADFDLAQELQTKWKTEPGQLWTIASRRVSKRSHRLLCGDGTRADHVAALTGEDTAGLVVADLALVGVDLGRIGSKRGRRPSSYEAHGISDAGLERLLIATFTAAKTALRSNAAWYVWHVSARTNVVRAALEAAGVEIRDQLVWVRPKPVLSRRDYHPRHELCAYGSLSGDPPTFLGPRDQDTAWQTEPDGAETNITAVEKPVALFTKSMANHLKPGEISFAPFANGGAHLVAGEQTGRIVYAIENEPKHVAVVLERMEGLGLEPRLSKNTRTRGAA